MKIVVDSGVDLCLNPEEMAELDIYQVPLSMTFRGKTYHEGKDISRDDFYSMLNNYQGDFPVTSQPSPGLIAETYKALAATDPDILSIHMSSGLSGTFAAASLAAKQVPEARVTLVDTKTLSAASGWQAAAAARALKRGWKLEQILPMLKRIGDAADSIYTLKELRYLIHGGRISHIKGLMASILNIKPLIGVEKVRGTYVQLGQVRTFAQALEGLAKQIIRHHPAGTVLRVQVVHGQNPEGAAILREAINKLFTCQWLPDCAISLILGAHTGPSVVGVAFAPAGAFEGMPQG
jgi:DegV family protein with EDD domain